MTKYLSQKVIQQGRCVDFPLVGRFYMRRVHAEDQHESSVFDQKEKPFVIFVPHLDFIESGKF